MISVDNIKKKKPKKRGPKPKKKKELSAQEIVDGSR